MFRGCKWTLVWREPILELFGKVLVHSLASLPAAVMGCAAAGLGHVHVLAPHEVLGSRLSQDLSLQTRAIGQFWSRSDKPLFFSLYSIRCGDVGSALGVIVESLDDTWRSNSRP